MAERKASEFVAIDPITKKQFSVSLVCEADGTVPEDGGETRGEAKVVLDDPYVNATWITAYKLPFNTLPSTESDWTEALVAQARAFIRAVQTRKAFAR